MEFQTKLILQLTRNRLKIKTLYNLKAKNKAHQYFMHVLNMDYALMYCRTTMLQGIISTTKINKIIYKIRN